MGENVVDVPRVAVIGAGISGVVSAAYLKEAGLEVTVYERANVAGGVWVYDDRSPIEPKYPAIKPSKGEETNDVLPSPADLHELEHAPPSPAYDGLTNNVATRLMKTKLQEWPEGTADFVNHIILERYIQTIAKTTGVDTLTTYGAKVTQLKKEDDRWSLTYHTLGKDSETGVVQKQVKTSIFDAVVVASGHYHAPRVPDIPGLDVLKARWPTRVFHSKAYRKPEQFRGKNVLLIGAGTSSTDIIKEIAPIAGKVYQSGRSGFFDLPAFLLPETAVRIGEVCSFDGVDGDEREDGTFPGTVTLRSGEKISNFDYIIVATGYHITLPFLSQYHEDDTPLTQADNKVLVTDGTQIHNLHRDIWYIPDPSLIFVGIPYFTANFTLFEFQAIVVAAVLRGWATLPTQEAMRQEYIAKVAKNGYGRNFHSLLGLEVEYVNELLEWVNKDGERWARKPVEGHTPAWHEARQEQVARMKGIFDFTKPKAEVPFPPCST